jgi:DNA-binding IclR family transcriptional regulator
MTGRVLMAQRRAVVADRESRSGGLHADSGPGYVQRTLIALDLLADRSLNTSELATALDVHRRTATRLAEVMRQSGWIEDDPEDPPRLRLSLRALTVAGKLISRMDLARIATPFVTSLRDRLNESSHLAVPTDGWVVPVVDKWSTHAIAYRSKLGERTYIHSSATGKAIAAHNPDQLELAIRRGLPRFTPWTITDPDRLEEALQEIRGRGYSVDDRENQAEVRCIAAPVRDGLGHVVGAIGISGPVARVTSDAIADFSAIVVDEAVRLSRALGSP